MKSIIIYYSRAGENYVSGEIKNLAKGNTEIAAETISDLTGAPLFKIEQKQPYSQSYNDCIEEARADKHKNARPELISLPKDMSDYDRIYLGYPNYWSTMPMALFTFLESFDLSNKTICPFCTHEGSGAGTSLTDLKALCPNSKIKKPLTLYGGKAPFSRPEITKWLTSIG